MTAWLDEPRNPNAPLAGLKVVELARVLAGPFCGQILADLGAHKLRLMTNNPAKYGGIAGYGLEIVDRVPIATAETPENSAYLRTKRERMGHLLDPSN